MAGTIIDSEIAKLPPEQRSVAKQAIRALPDKQREELYQGVEKAARQGKDQDVRELIDRALRGEPISRRELFVIAPILGVVGLIAIAAIAAYIRGHGDSDGGQSGVVPEGDGPIGDPDTAVLSTRTPAQSTKPAPTKTPNPTATPTSEPTPTEKPATATPERVMIEQPVAIPGEVVGRVGEDGTFSVVLSSGETRTYDVRELDALLRRYPDVGSLGIDAAIDQMVAHMNGGDETARPPAGSRPIAGWITTVETAGSGFTIKLTVPNGEEVKEVAIITTRVLAVAMIDPDSLAIVGSDAVSIDVLLNGGVANGSDVPDFADVLGQAVLVFEPGPDNQLFQIGKDKLHLSVMAVVIKPE